MQMRWIASLLLVMVTLSFQVTASAPAGEGGAADTAVEANLHEGEKELPPSDSMDIFIRLDTDFDMKLSAKELNDAVFVGYFKPELGTPQ